jgi:hypothetical protein
MLSFMARRRDSAAGLPQSSLWQMGVDLEAYFRQGLADPAGGYRFLWDQDIFQIRPRT